MDTGAVQYSIFIVSIALSGSVISLVLLMTYMQRKKIQYILEREREKAKFEDQLLRTEVEITDQNLKNISWELHDNIGQLLSVASMEAKMLMQKETLEGHQLEDIVDVIGQSIAQVRGLAKTLNSEMIQKLGLKEALENELNRLERIGLLKTKLEFSDEVIIEKNKEIIIFRILQEFISNVLKHAQASELVVKVSVLEGKVFIRAHDNGIGFDKETTEVNNGLLNLESRAKLIDAKLSLDSKVGQGTNMVLIFDHKISNHEKI